MAYLVICGVALLASGLTFFSGFGLGTLLVPAFSLFFAVEQAIALTAIVHFLNGVFKLALVWRYVDPHIVVRFGVPAIFAAFLGAWALLRMSGADPLLTYSALGGTWQVTPAKLVVGMLLIVFAVAELAPAFHAMSFPPRLLPIGGLLSGFLGGLSGMQGALRSAFLVKAGLSKERYVATGAAIAFLIDVSRLTVYSRLVREQEAALDYVLLAAAVVSAFIGAAVGNRYLRKVSMPAIKGLVAALLFLVGAALVAGVL